MRIRKQKKILTSDLFLERNVHAALRRRVEKVVQVQEASKKRKRGRPPKNNSSPNVGVQKQVMGSEGNHGNQQGIVGDSQGNQGRCIRNDGKKWRCYNAVEPNEDYCIHHSRMRRIKKNGEYRPSQVFKTPPRAAPAKPPITNADFQPLHDLTTPSPTAFTVPIKPAIRNVEFHPLPDLITPSKTDIPIKPDFSQCVYSGKAMTPANISHVTAEKMDSPVRPQTPAQGTDAQLPPHQVAGNTQARSQLPVEVPIAVAAGELVTRAEDSGPNPKKPLLALNDDRSTKIELAGEKLNGAEGDSAVNMCNLVVDKPVTTGNMEVLTQASSSGNMQLVAYPDPGQISNVMEVGDVACIRELKDEIERLSSEVADKEKLIEKLCVEDFKRRIEVEEMMKKYKEMESMKREGTALMITLRDSYMKSREENLALKAENAALQAKLSR